MNSRHLIAIVSLLLILAVASVAQVFTAGAKRQGIFDASGKPFSKVHRRTKEPKVVVDTVRMKSGYGSLSLRDRFTREGHDVTPTSNKTMVVIMNPEMVDTTDTPPTYGWQMSTENNRLIISSSNANDSLRVGVMIIGK